MRTATQRGVFDDQYQNYLGLLRDSTLKMFDLKSCTSVRDQGRNLMRYQFEPRDARKAPYLKLVFFTDPATMALKKMDVEINPQFSRVIKSYTLVIEERSIKVADGKWNNLRSMFLNNNGELKSPYSNYTYRDLKK